MMNYLLTVCLGASLWAAPATKGAPDPGDPRAAVIEARATTLTRALSYRIRLNEGQYIAVKQLHVDMLTERRDLELLLATAPAAERDAHFAQVQERYETSLVKLLKPEQLVAYQALRENMTAHRVR